MDTTALHLFHGGVSLGRLTGYSYATPWADAWLNADDPATIPAYAARFAFLAWVETIPDELPDADADALFTSELAARGLAAAEIATAQSGWEIATADGVRHPVSICEFTAEGIVTWRW